MKVVAFLPVKKSSKRVPNKNKKLLDGKPLFLHTLEKLAECDFIDEVYLHTESQEYFDMASNVSCSHLKLDSTLATNDIDGNVLFMNGVELVDADIYIQVLCTSPFINKSTISNGINILKENENYDSVVLMQKENMYLWENDVPKYDISRIPNSYDLPDLLIETMGLYIIKKDAAINTRRRIGDNPYLLKAHPMEAIDIN